MFCYNAVNAHQFSLWYAEFCAGESVSVLKFVDVVDDPKAVNQDKKNILFSVCDNSIISK